jgi:hypothetical protein
LVKQPPDFGKTAPKLMGCCDYQLLTSQQPPVDVKMLQHNFGSQFSNFAKHFGSHWDNLQK